MSAVYPKPPSPLTPAQAVRACVCEMRRRGMIPFTHAGLPCCIAPRTNGWVYRVTGPDGEHYVGRAADRKGAVTMAKQRAGQLARRNAA